MRTGDLRPVWVKLLFVTAAYRPAKERSMVCHRPVAGVVSSTPQFSVAGLSDRVEGFGPSERQSRRRLRDSDLRRKRLT